MGSVDGNQQPACNSAESLAAAALLFIAENEVRLNRFLAETGLTPADLRARAHEPLTLSAVLDHIVADESLLLVFAIGAGIDPPQVWQAKAALSGADGASPVGHDQNQANWRPQAGAKRWPGPKSCS